MRSVVTQPGPTGRAALPRPADSKHPQADGGFFQRREFCFTLDGDIFVRYQSFKASAKVFARFFGLWCCISPHMCPVLCGSRRSCRPTPAPANPPCRTARRCRRPSRTAAPPRLTLGRSTTWTRSGAARTRVRAARGRQLAGWLADGGPCAAQAVLQHAGRGLPGRCLDTSLLEGDAARRQL